MADKYTNSIIELQIKCIGSDKSLSANSANQLFNQLKDQKQDLKINRSSSNGSIQSAGDLLSIFLAGPAVIVISKGIADYIRNRMSITLVLTKGDKSLKITGSSKSVQQLIENFLLDR